MQLKWAVDAASEYVLLRRDATYISVLLLNEEYGVVVGFTPAVNDGILFLKKDSGSATTAIGLQTNRRILLVCVLISEDGLTDRR